jgi:hypothetical protein
MSVTLTESVAAVGAALLISVSSGVTVADASPSAIISTPTASVQESITTSEYRKALTTHNISVSDSTTLSESSSVVLTDPKTNISYSITVGESTSGFGSTLSISETETIGVSDVIDQITSDLLPNVYEDIAISELITEAMLAEADPDNISISESASGLAADLLPSVVESVSIAEWCWATGGPKVCITLAESAAASVSTLKAVAAAEAISVTEEILWADRYASADPDDIAIGEWVKVVMPGQVILSDSVSIGESSSGKASGVSIDISDALVVTESTEGVGGEAEQYFFFRNCHDRIRFVSFSTENILEAEASATEVTVADSDPAVSLSVARTKEPFEAVSVADPRPTVHIGHNIVVSESLQLIDTIGYHVDLNPSVSQAIAISESLAPNVINNISVSQGIALGESLTYSASAALLIEINITWEPTISVGESVGGVASDPQIDESEGVSINELLAPSLPSVFDRKRVSGLLTGVYNG